MEQAKEKYLQQIISTLENEDENLNKIMLEVLVDLLNKNLNDITTEKYLLKQVKKIQDSKDA